MYMSNQLELRNKIKVIQSDINLTITEKNIKIQQLMSRNSPLSNNSIISTCTHYPNKKCDQFYFTCCNKRYNCIRCHNEYEEHNRELKTIKCTDCNLEQEPSNCCINCEINFSPNYCNICYIWTDNSITHCNKCELCRVGESDKLFHCDVCNACFSSENKENHKCSDNLFINKNCAYCLESTFSGQDSALAIRCGHVIHTKCLKDSTDACIYKCPLCRKLIYDVDWTQLKYAIKLQPMPIEIGDIVTFNKLNKLFKVKKINNNLVKGYFINTVLQNKKVYASLNIKDLNKEPRDITVFCNECEEYCVTNFHYLGNECINCNSFNTV